MQNRLLELLDRSSLHAVDSFFNVLRRRASYFHRAGLSRASQSHYNAFQPYRPDMVQKIVDIARVYFNWVEPRPFRLARKFEALDPNPNDPWHERLETGRKEQQRQTKREQTPAMRMFLANKPMKLEYILYTDWLEKLALDKQPRPPKKRKRKPDADAQPVRQSPPRGYPAPSLVGP